VKRFAQNQLPALVWIVIIFWLSSIHSIPNLRIPMSDKIAHLGFYGILCGLSYRAFFLQEKFPSLKQCAVLAALLFTILYGITDEIHQLFVWGRTADILDVTADTIGGLLFLAAFSIYQRRKSGSPSSAMHEAQD
jgi:VanZ family protein